jgi:hypothetical protein
MAGVPFAQQRVRVEGGGQGFLTRRTIAILEDAGREVGLNLVGGVEQGSFCPGCVAASGGSHDRGGVFDLRGSHGLAVPKVEKALRERGVAAWIRLPPKFSLHLHGVDAFDPDLSDLAKSQVEQYKAGTDGLAGHNKETTGRPHPTLRRFPDPMEVEPIRKVPTMFLVKQDDTDRVWAITGDGKRRFVASTTALKALEEAGVPFNRDTSWTSKLLQSFPQEPNSDITDRRP